MCVTFLIVPPSVRVTALGGGWRQPSFFERSGLDTLAAASAVLHRS